jgi:hypothetical protein
MQTNVKKLIATLILLFVTIFVFRFIAGFFFKFERVINTSRSQESFIGSSFMDINYERAVSSNLRKVSTEAHGYTDANIGLLEVFAKEARMRSSTAQFEVDESKTRSAVNKHGALIRIEKKEGLKPHRKLQLVIRIPESKFDALVNDLQSIGIPDSFQVSKEDKSEEAKKLLVEKKSLEEYRKALVALRKAGGKVEEFLALEGKIQEVQRKIEELDASIGRFAGTESFNNISFDLGEKMIFYVDPNAYPVSARIIDALMWTLKYYLVLVFLAGAIGIIVWSGNTVLLRK